MNYNRMTQALAASKNSALVTGKIVKFPSKSCSSIDKCNLKAYFNKAGYQR